VTLNPARGSCARAGTTRHVIDQGQTDQDKKRLDSDGVDRRISGVPDFTKKSPDHKIRRPSSAREAISAVKMSERLTADVDAWAEAHDMVRSDAIRQLVELGLNAAPAPSAASPDARRDPLEIEDLAVKRIGELLDPSLPTEERERRIRRLTEGPPEFIDEPIDLPKPRK
jgi:hypothetical protein